MIMCFPFIVFQTPNQKWKEIFYTLNIISTGPFEPTLLPNEKDTSNESTVTRNGKQKHMQMIIIVVSRFSDEFNQSLHLINIRTYYWLTENGLILKDAII